MFVASHRIPGEGLPAWRQPDPNASPEVTIGGGLLVQVLEQHANGWAHILCDNGWSAWVDGRRLVPI